MGFEPAYEVVPHEFADPAIWDEMRRVFEERAMEPLP